MKKLLFVTLLFVSSICFASDGQNTKPVEQQTAIVQQTTQNIKSSYQDAFLGFVLEKAEKYSEKGEQVIGKAVDLATEEAPILAKEYLRWNFWKNLLYFLIPVVLSSVLWCLFTFLIKRADFDLYNWNKYATLSILNGVCASCATIAIFDNFDNLFTAIQVYIAPRVFIMEQVLQLIK